MGAEHTSSRWHAEQHAGRRGRAGGGAGHPSWASRRGLQHVSGWARSHHFTNLVLDVPVLQMMAEDPPLNFDLVLHFWAKKTMEEEQQEEEAAERERRRGGTSAAAHRRASWWTAPARAQSRDDYCTSWSMVVDSTFAS